MTGQETDFEMLEMAEATLLALHTARLPGLSPAFQMDG